MLGQFEMYLNFNLTIRYFCTAGSFRCSGEDMFLTEIEGAQALPSYFGNYWHKYGRIYFCM
jgi:hypothetical protein